MKLSCVSAAVFILASRYMQGTQAIPAWDIFASRRDIGEMVPGSTFINALTVQTPNKVDTHYLRTSAEPGVEANATVSEWHHPHGPPSRFFVSKGILHQITNHTHILYADLVNATAEMDTRDPTVTNSVSRPAFKLRFTKEKPQLLGGSWEWFTSMLQFHLGKRSNYGVFYKCAETTGETNVYVPLNPGRVPSGCEILTLISNTVRKEHQSGS